MEGTIDCSFVACCLVFGMYIYIYFVLVCVCVFVGPSFAVLGVVVAAFFFLRWRIDGQAC
jgi:hypothetical protein